MSEPIPTLEQRVKRMEECFLSFGPNLKQIIEYQKKAEAVSEQLKASKITSDNILSSLDSVGECLAFFLDGLDQLGEGLLLLDTRQKNMTKFLCNSDIPAAKAVKDDFLKQIADEEKAAETVKLFLHLVKQAREAIKRKNPPVNPPGA